MNTNTFKPNLELCEAREVPASTATVVSGNTLLVQGDATANNTAVIVSNDAVRVTENGTTVNIRDGTNLFATHTITGLTTIKVGGKEGPDILSIIGDGTLAKVQRIEIYGDSGTDQIRLNLRSIGLPTFYVDGDNYDLRQRNQGARDDQLTILGVALKSFTMDGIERVSKSKLALAQEELRDTNIHPEMNNLWKMLTVTSTMIQSTAGARSVTTTIDLIAQFEVESDVHAGRYRPGGSNNYDTRCNVAVGDWLRVANAAIPTKAEFTNGGDKNLWIGATNLNQWLNGATGNGTLKKSGKDMGWTKLDLTNKDARVVQAEFDKLLAHVKAGKLALVSTTDHVALVRPDQDLSRLTWADRGKIVTAQAGRTNFTRGTVAAGWGDRTDIEIFIHD